MDELKLINLGIYYEHLRSIIEGFYLELPTEKDPYKQWMIREKISLTSTLLEDYERLIMKQ